MPTYTTYEQVGQKEEVSDIISNLSPTDVPFSSDIGSDKITAKLFEWQEDSLRDPAANAKADGADATDKTASPTVMRNNLTQIMSDTVKVAGTSDAIGTYGRAKETAYQTNKIAKELKRDLEYAYVTSGQTKVTGDNSGPVARKMAGAQAQIDSSLVFKIGASTDLNEADLMTALQAVYTAGSDVDTIMVTPSNSVIITEFAKAAGRYRQVSQGKTGTAIVNNVDLYVSPFGEQKVKLNRWMKAKDTLLYNAENWRKAVLRPWTREVLAKVGDATRSMILGEFSLKHMNFKASALISDNTAAS